MLPEEIRSRGNFLFEIAPLVAEVDRLPIHMGTSFSCVLDLAIGFRRPEAARAAQFAKLLGYSEAQLVRLALQDEVERAGLHMKVKVEVA